MAVDQETKDLINRSLTKMFNQIVKEELPKQIDEKLKNQTSISGEKTKDWDEE